MSNQRYTRQQQSSTAEPDTPRENGHLLARITQWLPGEEPTEYDITLSEGDGYRTRFWRCEFCGQERNRRSEFREHCTVETPPTPLSDGGYDIKDPRTRRAVTENMEVRFGDRGCVYAVDSESGSTYEVDVLANTCTCPDHRKRDTVCKHLRRVDLDIRGGNVPRPNGTFMR